MLEYDAQELANKIYPWVTNAWKCMVRNITGYAYHAKSYIQENFREENYEKAPEQAMRHFAAILTQWLLHGACACGRKDHDIKSFPTSGLTLDRFLECAVTGPRGLPRTRKGKISYGIEANSFSRGMFFELIEDELKVVNLVIVNRTVAFVECKNHKPAKYHYWGQQHCSVCNASFHEGRNKTVARNWIILQEKFREDKRWRCKCGNIYSLSYETCPLNECTESHPSHGNRVFHVWVPICKGSTKNGPAAIEPPPSPELKYVVNRAVIKAVRKFFNNLRGWQHILFLFIMRENPHRFTAENAWRALLEGCYQPGEQEILDLGFSIKRLKKGRYTFERVAGGITSEEIWQQIYHHAQSIANHFKMETFEVPNQASSVRQQIRRQAKMAAEFLREELERQGIDWASFEEWRYQQQNRNFNQEISGESYDS